MYSAISVYAVCIIKDNKFQRLAKYFLLNTDVVAGKGVMGYTGNRINLNWPARPIKLKFENRECSKKMRQPTFS